MEEGILSFILHPSHPHIFTSVYVCSSDCSLSSLIPLSSSSTFGETRRKAAQPAGYFPAGERQYLQTGRCILTWRCENQNKSCYIHMYPLQALCSIRFLDQLPKQKRLSYLNQVLVCFALFLYCYTKRKIEVRGREGKRGEERGREGRRRGYTFDGEVLCHETCYMYTAMSSLQEERHCQNTTTPR